VAVGYICTAVLKLGPPVFLGPAPAPVWSLQVGVGHLLGVFTIWTKLWPVMASVIVPPRWASDALGVAQRMTCALNFGSPLLLIFPLALFTQSSATGVCQNPDSLSMVRGAHIGRSHNSPLRIKPERGKISKHLVKSSRNESWAVFNERETGSYLANDAGHVVPHAAARSVDASPPPGDTDVLAWKPTSHDVNNASPWASVKGLHVIPNRERREGSIVLSCHKHSLGVGVPFDGAHRSVSKQLTSEDAATSACE